jgi:hypothetical protein
MPLDTVCVNTPAVLRRLAICKDQLKHYDHIGAFEHLSEKPALLQPLHVVVRENKTDRLVIDLSRNLNDELSAPQFNLPHFQEAVELSSQCCWYGKCICLTVFYHLTYPDSRRFLAFELDGKFYRWKRLPFRLMSSPFWCEEFLGVIELLRAARKLRPSLALTPRLQMRCSDVGIAKQGISTHSLRRGGTTALALAGVPEASIQAHGRWSSLEYRSTSVTWVDSALQRRPTAMLLDLQRAA